jgi:hypothetical protein
MCVLEVPAGDESAGELGSRSNAGAAPATVAKLKVATKPLGKQGLGMCRDGPEGRLRSPETSLKHRELD